MTHICITKLTIIGSNNGLSPTRHQAIIWTNDGILLIWPIGTNFSEMLIRIHTFSFKKMHFKMSSGYWRPFCLDINVLIFAGCHCSQLQWHPSYVNVIFNRNHCFDNCKTWENHRMEEIGEVIPTPGQWNTISTYSVSYKLTDKIIVTDAL